MYCTIHLLEIIRLSDFSSPLFYPSLLGSAALYRTIYWILKNVQKQAIQQNKGLTFMEFLKMLSVTIKMSSNMPTSALQGSIVKKIPMFFSVTGIGSNQGL